MVEHSTIQAEDKELYTYGLKQGIIMLITFLTSIIIGYLFHMLLESILYLIFYMMLRVYAGGYHAKTPKQCYFISVLIMISVLSFLKVFSWTILIIYYSCILPIGIIFFLMPVEDKNKPLDKEEIIVYKKKGRYTLLLEFLILAAFTYFHLFNLAGCIVIVFYVMAGMLILGKIKNTVYKKEKNESSF